MLHDDKYYCKINCSLFEFHGNERSHLLLTLSNINNLILTCLTHSYIILCTFSGMLQ